jgi:predicted ATP-grasp superfamily ATP-dependent carboligase
MSDNTYIILGLTPQGLALLRGLGKAGADVTAFCTSKKNVGYHSRYGKRICFHAIAELRTHINNIVVKSPQKPICFITSGEILASVLREYKELYNECKVFSGPYPVIELLAHKDKMYEYAVNKGFNVAKFATLDKYIDGCLKFPLFLKRNYEIPLFFKAVKINTPEEFSYYINKIPAESLQDVIAQEYIDIPNKQLLNITCQGFFVNGVCAGTFIANQKRRLRKGITSYIEELPENKLSALIRKQSEKFMLELKYCGFAEFEFMYDSLSEQLYFIEINTRTCGIQSALHHKFNNLSEVITHPDTLIKLHSKTEKLHWMNIQRDIRARMESRDFSHLCDIFKSRYDILDWKDLKPFFRQFI